MAASLYPLAMGIRVVGDMLKWGTVMQENYPKYIIPYTSVAVALLAGLAVLPLCRVVFGKRAFWGAAALALSLFFAAELILEQLVVVTTTEIDTTLEHWQMYMCYIGTTYKTQTPVEILMGSYHPAFKLHFYMICVVLILGTLSCLYGFGQLIVSGNQAHKRPLVLQAAATGIFLGLCILACFTAFWRDGSLQVSPLSAVLMAVFFIILGMVGGLFAASFVKNRWLPALIASGLSLAMYLGEMVLLSGRLYQLGEGFFFRSLPGIVLSCADVAIILASGLLTALVLGKNRSEA